MAQSTQTPQEFIQNAFSPMIAVMNSPSVDLITQKNNLNFVELLQPFSRLSCEGYLKDPSGAHYSVRNLKLTICNVNTRPPQPILARKFLNESVSNAYSDKTTNLQFGNYNIDIPTSTPWFEAWRETFFHVQFPSDHEYTKHFVSCLLVASTSEASPTESMAHMAQTLSQLQNVTPPKLPKWFNANVLRCYVLLHDAMEGNIDKAEKYYESIKNTYGAGNCFFLSINSRNPNEPDSGVLPDPWNKFLVRRMDNNEGGSDKDSLPRTPADMASVTGMPVVTQEGVGGGGATTVQVHPLSPSEEADSTSFQNNCLQNEALTSSLDSDVGIINPNVWEPTSANGGAVHGVSLTTQDIENIKTFVQDFALKALLPYFERQIYQLQDAVSNKKGVSRSLLSATKRWFGTNKPGTNPPINSVIYTGDCPELQLRRLADVWFMVGQWAQAYQAYHAAKREYSADGAWLLYAGALEMAALAAFMANEASRKTFDYMEESIITYMNSCRMPQYAVRATLLSLQCLQSRALHGEAARQLIRMTSEECDLRSALLLEQAALCFLAGPPRKALPRKYAFHMVLAGHRYSKAGQRKHSLRCYRQAYQVYRGGGWRLATDHIEFAVGRLAGQVGEGWWGAASSALASLLAPRSLQSPQQQHAFLREFLHVRQQWLCNDPEQQNILPILPVPVLVSNSTIVWCGGVVGGHSPADAAPQAPLWGPLEEMLLYKAKGTAPMLFKPTLSFFCDTSDNSSNPITPQGEPIQVIVSLENPLLIDVTILDVQLLWQYKSAAAQRTAPEPGAEEVVFSNESCVTASREYDKSIVVTQKVPHVILHSDRVTNVSLSLTPLHPGELTLVGVGYRLCNPVPPSEEGNLADRMSVLGKQVFDIRGPKLRGVKEVGGEPQYGVDKRLNITVVPPAPCLQVSFTEVSPVLLCGELQRVSVQFRNAGRVALRALHMGTSHPQYVALALEGQDPFTPLLETRYLEPQLIQDERQLRLDKEKRMRNRHCVAVLGELAAGQSHSAQLWLQAPRRPGPHTLHALFYYEHTETTTQPKHRLLRHTWNITVQDSVQVSTVARRTLRPCKNSDKYEEALNLALEVKNANQVHHGIVTLVEVQQVSLLSQSWILDGFVPIQQDVKMLNSQETLHLIMKARRSAVKSKTYDIVSSDVRLDSDESVKIVSIREKPYSCFVTDYSSVFEDQDEEATNYNDSVSSDSQSINSTLVIRWKADITENGGFRRAAVGQHHLNLDKLGVKVWNLALADPSRGVESLPIKLFGSEGSGSGGPSAGKGSSQESDKKLVTFSLEHQLEVRHDFRKVFVCIIPVKMHLVNCSTKDVVAVINTSSPKSSTYKYSGISWVGAGGNESGGVQVGLGPLESGCVPLQLACTGPGTYSLGNILRVSCSLPYPATITAATSLAPPTPVAQTHVATSTIVILQTD